MASASVETAQPKTATEFIRKAWELHASGKNDDAEGYFRKAAAVDPKSIEAFYGLGLVYKAQDRRRETIDSFEKVLELIDAGVENRARGEMLRRLALAHINRMRDGDWGLEKEIWKHN